MVDGVSKYGILVTCEGVSLEDRAMGYCVCEFSPEKNVKALYVVEILTVVRRFRRVESSLLIRCVEH